MILLYAARTKGQVARGVEGGQNDSPEHIVDGEFIHVRETVAGVADLKQVVIDSIQSVAIHCHCDSHEADESTSEELGLHAYVIEEEGCEKCFQSKPSGRTKVTRTVFVKTACASENSTKNKGGDKGCPRAGRADRHARPSRRSPFSRRAPVAYRRRAHGQEDRGSAPNGIAA